MAAISTGFLYQNRRSKWAVVIAINAALLGIFLVNPLTMVFISSIPFAWLHIVAFIILLSPLSLMAAKWLQTLNYRKVVVGVALFAFMGAMIQHLMGNILFEVVLGQVIGSIPSAAYPGIWTSVFLVYPIERLILVIAATGIGTPLLYLLNRTPVLNPRNITAPPPPEQPK
jgi:hypothetical protein